MAEPLRFTRWVADDLFDAITWYEAKSGSLANRFRAAVEDAFEQVEKSREVFPFAFGDLNVRFYRLRRFPYLVLYQPQATLTLVVGVLHAASDLERLRRRLSG